MHRRQHLQPSAPWAYLLAAGAAVDVVGLRSWELPPATIAEVVYSGPTTRIAARNAAGVELTATLLSAETSGDLEHGAPVTLAWPDSAVRDLNTKPEEQQ